MDTNGSNVTLFPFFENSTASGPEYALPGLVLASDGNFWLINFNNNALNGSIVTLSPSNGALLGTLTPFGTSTAVGTYPSALIQAKDGTLWGTTAANGQASQNQFGDGVVYSLNAGLPAP